MKKKAVFHKLERVQRLALQNLFGVMRFTPTAAMDVLVGMAPLDLYLQGRALKAMARTRQSWMWNDVLGPGITNRFTHTELCKRLSVEVPEMEFQCDHNTETLPSERLFSVTKRSRQEWETAGSPKPSTQVLSCLTDGSRLKECTGAAFFLNSEHMDQFPLGEHPSL